MDDLPPLDVSRIPTPTRPLLGHTILVVEDSRYACETLRLMCLRSGARIRRADCLQSARRHLKVYRPSVAIIDLGLPDGSGADLISELNRTSPRITAILGLSGDDFADTVAIAAGADGFLSKPLGSLAAFQEAILSRLPSEMQPSGPRIVPDEVITPDPLAYRDDMEHLADVLDDGTDAGVLDYVTQFVTGLARSAQDRDLLEAGEALAAAKAGGRLAQADIARLAGMVQDRLAENAVV